jgi:hypothetical protein
MTSPTVVRYLFGSAAAIRSVAADRMAIPVGILFCILAGLARHYDQTLLAEQPLIVLRSWAFSLVSGAMLSVGMLWPGKTTGLLSLRAFFGLFWMTAPLAWLYAFPVERWFEPVLAAKANLAFLAIVAFWRVVLMVRVLFVLTAMPVHQCLWRVMIPASLEVLVIAFLGRLYSALAGMGGLDHSPAEEVLINATKFALIGAIAVFIVAVGAAMFSHTPLRPSPVALARDAKLRVPWLVLGGATVFFSGLAVAPQREWQRHHDASALAARKDWAGFVAFLSQHDASAFPPSVRLPPNVTWMSGFHDLPRFLSQLKPTTPPWIAQYYLPTIELAIRQSRFWNADKTSEAESLIQIVEAIPNGKEMLRRAADRLEQECKDRPPADGVFLAKIVSQLRR